MQDNNNIVGFVTGVFGGAGSYTLLNIQDTTIQIGVAIATALLCGFAGVAGKEFFYYLKGNKKRNK